MREIKCRAYSNDTKTMYPYAIQWFNWELWVHKNNPHNGEWKNIWCWNDEEIVDYSYELMQFTWLIDKNGKKIYEWDLLKWRKNEETRYVWEVYFDEEILAYFIRSEWKEYHLCDLENPEIIWNIYENKDLLSN